MNDERLGRGWAFPFRFDPARGGVALASGEASIRAALAVILGTRPGERPMQPEFGCRVHEVLFAPGGGTSASLVAYHVRHALERWEPRIEVLDVSARSVDAGAVSVEVSYRIRATRTDHVLSLDLPTGA